MSNMPNPFDPIAHLAEQFPAAFALTADAPSLGYRHPPQSLYQLWHVDWTFGPGGELSVTFDGRAVIYGFGELDALLPASAATIHKSQGSKYLAVVIPVLTQHYPMLQRNLLYTCGIRRIADRDSDASRTAFR